MNTPTPTPDRHAESSRLAELEAAIAAGLTRRELIERGLFGLLLAGGAAMLLGGCSSGSKRAGSAALPNPRWPIEDVGREGPRPAQTYLPKQTVPQPLDIPTDVIPRSQWARGNPILSRMNRADRRFDRITIHHDGIDAFTSTSREAAARRLEQIRQAHLNRKGEPFGDIGYHYAIDPAGRVWAGRDTAWQGAHVAGQNPGNLGICMLGNYNRQQPNGAQRAALDRFVRFQMSRLNVAIGRVKTHKELAQTECPGVSLQSYVVATRRVGMKATATA